MSELTERCDGWTGDGLLPMLTQKLGGSFWLANFIQAGTFGRPDAV